LIEQHLGNPLVLAALLFVGTFVLEEAAILLAAGLAASDEMTSGLALAALVLASAVGRSWALAQYGLSITHVWPDARELGWVAGLLLVSAVAGLLPAALAYRRTLADGLASPG